MIIQNLSLRVLERAALVDVTNWLVPRALLAVKDQALALRLQNFLRRLPLQLFRWQSSHSRSMVASIVFNRRLELKRARTWSLPNRGLAALDTSKHAQI